jgi:hypothetical protein
MVPSTPFGMTPRVQSALEGSKLNQERVFNMIEQAQRRSTLLSLDAIAAQGNFSKRTLRRLIDEGTIEAIYISERVVRIREEAWLAHLDKCSTSVSRAAA